MKYPKIKAEWQPIANPEVNVTSQELKIYINGSLREKRVFDRWASEHEFDKMKLATPVSEGWLYEKNECVIKIFASYDRDEDGIVFGERTVIPLSCVKKMRKLN